MAPKTIAALMLDTLVLSAGCQLRAQASPLAEAVVACEFHQHPSLRERYGPVGSMRLREDTVQHLSYLADALDAHSPALFDDYIGWVKVLMLQRGMASEDLVHHLECMAATVQAQMPSLVARPAVEMIEGALAALPAMPSTSASTSLVDSGQRLSLLATRYLHTLPGG